MVALSIFAANAPRADQDQLCSEIFTHTEMNACTRAEFISADNELNQVYQRIVREYADDPVFLDKLRKAQRAWLAFRDAELQALYPYAGEDSRLHYGSVWPVCANLALEELTRERSRELRRWLEGVPEGDVCAGSVRRR